MSCAAPTANRQQVTSQPKTPFFLNGIAALARLRLHQKCGRAKTLTPQTLCEGILEDPGDDRLLIYGTVQNAAGRIIEAPPLVQVSFARVSRGARRQASHQPP
jgi:hypothetical protein